MTNLIAFLALALIVGGACAYIYREKKRGVVCVGCPHACMRDPKTGKYVCGGSCAGGGCAAGKLKDAASDA